MVLKVILLNNFKAIVIFLGSLIMISVNAFFMYALTETRKINYKAADSVMVVVSLLVLVLSFISGRKFLKSSGNMIIDALSFVIIIAITAIFVFLTSMKQNDSVFIARIGVVYVVVSCLVQYIGLLTKAYRP